MGTRRSYDSGFARIGGSSDSGGHGFRIGLLDGRASIGVAIVRRVDHVGIADGQRDLLRGSPQGRRKISETVHIARARRSLSRLVPALRLADGICFGSPAGP